MVPALVTGWLDWKRNYHASRARLFKRKIGIGIGMLVVSAAAAIFRGVYYSFEGAFASPYHLWFTVIVVVLFGGAVAEGFYGGHLIRR